MICGMTLTSPHDTSPHDKSRDEKTKEAVLQAFPPSWRQAIFVAGASDSQCSIELKPPVTEEAALGIGRAFERAFPGREVTLNGVYLAEALALQACHGLSGRGPGHLRPL